MIYPIGIQTFEKLRDGGFVYVDKTALVYKLVTEGRVYFLSRPRALREIAPREHPESILPREEGAV